MKYKAKVDILQERDVEGMTFVEADVEIKGIVKRRRFTIPIGSSVDDVKKVISDRLKEEENRNVIGEKFEVEL